MAVAVDTEQLLDGVLPTYDQSAGTMSLQLHRLYASVAHDAAARDNECGIPNAKQEAALADWQAEPGDDEDKVEGLHHHLEQLAATTTTPGVGSSRPGSGGVESRAGTTTLVASVQSVTFTSCTQHRTPSSSSRYSTRCVQETNIRNMSSTYCSDTGVTRVTPDIDVGKQPKRVSTDAEERNYSVVCLRQLDLSSQTTYSGKRRRTLNPFHYVSPRRDEDHTARARDHPAAPEVKRFKGVRYRPDHNRWVAEMKPPRSKNKVSFGEFRSQSDAARVVDVAFQQYGRPLNFPDSTPHIPSSADLSVEAKLQDIRKQTKLMKEGFIAAPPNRSTSDANSDLRPFSAIGHSLILHTRCRLVTTAMAAGARVSSEESRGV